MPSTEGKRQHKGHRGESGRNHGTGGLRRSAPTRYTALMVQRLGVLIALVLVLSLPFIVRATAAARARGVVAPTGSPKLVIITPHVEQIRDEFERGFDRWHYRVHHQHVAVDWRTPGGTSEIIKQLEATMEAAARNG